MTLGKKYSLANLTTYTTLGVAYSAAEYYYPSGPLTPGPGILVMLFVPILAIILLAVALIGRLRGNHALTGPLLINATVLVSWIILVFF